MSETATILVIDDDPDFREIYRVILEGQGYTVVEAGDAKTGAQLAQEHKPSLILLDVMMEEVDAGFTFAEEMGRNYPIMLVSSIADSSVKVFDADQLPVRDIIQKPAKPDVLIEKVKRVLSEKIGG